MDKLTLFIGVTSAAVVLQMLILLAMYMAVRKLGTRMEAVAAKVENTTAVVQTRVLPLIDNAKTLQQDIKGFLDTAKPKFETIIDNTKNLQQDVKAFLDSAKPKVDTIVGNASSISTTARTTLERFDVTANDAIDRIRLQVIRGDEMLTRTMDRVEETSEKVQHTVMSPVRQVSGIVQAISSGFGAYFHTQRRRRNGGPSDEMFI